MSFYCQSITESLTASSVKLAITVKREGGLVDGLPNMARALNKQMSNKCSQNEGKDEGICIYQQKKPWQLPKGRVFSNAV